MAWCASHEPSATGCATVALEQRSDQLISQAVVEPSDLQPPDQPPIIFGREI